MFRRKANNAPVTAGVARVPVIMQMEALECGAACLAMVLAFYGKWIPLEQTHKDCGVSRDGSKAGNVARAARAYGLKAQGYRYDPEKLRAKGRFPCIVTLIMIREMLKDLYDVTEASSGIQAMTAIGKRRPDLILLDYEMPVCDGRQTLEMIRADEELKDIPVVFLTGIDDKYHIESVLKLKPQGYLLKPTQKADLIETVRKNIGE